MTEVIATFHKEQKGQRGVALVLTLLILTILVVTGLEPNPEWRSPAP
jgi:hypothetical protein